MFRLDTHWTGGTEGSQFETEKEAVLQAKMNVAVGACGADVTGPGLWLIFEEIDGQVQKTHEDRA